MKPNVILQWLLFSLLLALTAGCAPSAEPAPQAIQAPAEQQPAEVAQLPPEQQATAVLHPSGILTGGGSVNVSPSSVNSVPPEDVLHEINFGAAGGGVDCARGQGEYTQPEFENTEGYGTVTQMEAPLLLSCGWSDMEQISVTVRYPDGREVARTFQAVTEEGVPQLSIYYQVSIDDPPGTYTVIEEGSSGRIETSFNASSPAGPLLVYVLDDPFDATVLVTLNGSPTRLLLYGFAANESVQLLMYRAGSTADWSLIGSQQVTTGPDGNLVVANQIPEANFWIAVGERSGSVAVPKINLYGRIIGPWVGTVQCRMAYPSRVDVGMKIRPVDNGAGDLPIYAGPGFSQEVVGQVPAGTIMDVSYTPECADGTWWWYVQAGDMLGVVAEADSNGYLIEPVQ